MTGTIQAVRGMHDILPDESMNWQYIEQSIRDTLQSYGYQEIRMPVVEKTGLFERSIGETSDIVSREMYTFNDRNGDLLTLRPEGTAGCVRACLEHGLFQGPALRLWYSGPMFRHERPQKGRLRQFHQIGVETFGIAGPDIDAEIILMCARIWKHLGLDDIHLEINSLGSTSSRAAYRKSLHEYFQDHKQSLDEDSMNRLDKNPLRILDSKNPAMQDLINSAPDISESLDAESSDHYQELLGLLDATGISYRKNPRLVRGLDYYNRTVFEWTTTSLGSQGTVCAGGRYDGLVEQFGGASVPAIGFAMGLERLVALLAGSANTRAVSPPDIYFIVASERAMAAAQLLAERLRDELPGFRLLLHCGGGSFKSQFKKADKSGARLALIMGDKEFESQRIGIKPLRRDGDQIEVPWADITQTILQQLDR